MLQQILTEMYIDPDVLDALNEDQKKTLFLKMRQEQVRRWKEREEKLEREGEDAECKRTKPKTDNSKSVSWLLGRDGDVAVIVIGEVDELSSKFISGFGEKKSPTLQNNAYLQTILKSKTTTEPIRAERENLPPITQPGVSLNLKGKCEERSASLPLPVSVSERLSPPAAAESPDATEKPVLQSTSCTVRSTPFSVRPASANAAPGSLNSRSEIQRPAAATPSTSLSNAVIANAKAPTGLQSQGPKEMQGSQGGKETPQAAASQETKLPSTCTGRGRVAQLMKTFSVENSAAPTPRGIKPPLPSKPSHLRLTSTPTVR